MDQRQRRLDLVAARRTTQDAYIEPLQRSVIIGRIAACQNDRGRVRRRLEDQRTIHHEQRLRRHIRGAAPSVHRQRIAKVKELKERVEIVADYRQVDRPADAVHLLVRLDPHARGLDTQFSDDRFRRRWVELSANGQQTVAQRFNQLYRES